MREIGRPLRESVRCGLNAWVSRGMRESWQVWLEEVIYTPKYLISLHHFNFALLRLVMLLQLVLCRGPVGGLSIVVIEAL